MKSIEQVVTFNASPRRVFEALMDSKRHAAFTGEAAQVGREVGSAFSVYGGKVSGITLDVEADTRIVQAWRTGNLPQGVFTIATFALVPEGSGTKLTFTQVAVPEDVHAHLATGWDERYWKPLRAYLEQVEA